jgi:hypothetical protein
VARNWRYWIPIAFVVFSIGWCGYIGYTKWVSAPAYSPVSATSLEDPLAGQSNNILAGIDLSRVWPIAIPIVITLLVLLVAAGREWGLTAIGALALGVVTFASGIPVGQAYAPAIGAAAAAAALGAALE